MTKKMTKAEMIVRGNEMTLDYSRRQAVEALAVLVRYLRSRADDLECAAARAAATDGKSEHGTSEADLWRWLIDAAAAPVSNCSAVNALEIAHRGITEALAVRRVLGHLAEDDAE